MHKVIQEELCTLTSTFDRAVGKGEERVSAFEVLDRCLSLLHILHTGKSVDELFFVKLHD